MSSIMAPPNVPSHEPLATAQPGRATSRRRFGADRVIDAAVALRSWSVGAARGASCPITWSASPRGDLARDEHNRERAIYLHERASYDAMAQRRPGRPSGRGAAAMRVRETPATLQLE